MDFVLGNDELCLCFVFNLSLSIGHPTRGEQEEEASQNPEES